jgi:hypothetical protein
MRKLTSFVLTLSVLALLSPAPLVAQGQPTTGGLSGTATGPNGAVLQNAQIRIVSVGADGSRGAVATTTTSGADGAFSVANLNPGNYIVEIVGPNGAVVGTSTAVAVTAGATAAVGTVAATTALLTAAGLSTAAITTIVVAGVAVGATTLVVVTNDDSPSR